MLVLIDNYDSFTFNLVQYFQELGHEVNIFRNDQITLTGIADLNPQHLVISPGPCTPNESGISTAAINFFANKIPILGVCLGHQAIIQVFGGRLVHANKIMHGKTSKIYHEAQSVFKDLPSPFIATRYHSWVGEKASLPACLEITAWTEHEDQRFDEIMAVKHRSLPIHGIQFHPESIKTEYGHELLKNFLNE